MFRKLMVSFVIMGAVGLAGEEPEKWDVTQPIEPYDEVTIETGEGTWMNLDVSPNGKQIVFDLLGDIYIMPITGGKATLLREGHAWEVQPRFSPDGNMISFTSDAGGGDNIWVMDVNGTDAAQITHEDFRLLNNAVWTPDGNYLIARKHFTSQRSLGAGEIWMYHVSGGKGVQLTERKNDQQDVGEPWVSPDGRYVYFSEDMYPGGRFQYNKNPNSQIYVIRRYDREEGEVENYITGTGGAVRPQVSPDGSKLAFVRRVREKSVLYIYDFATGIDKPVYDRLSKDQQEAWAIFGVYPNFNWLPDNQHVILWAEGKIQKINVNTGEASEIPFRVNARHQITRALKFEQEAAPKSFNVKVIRHATVSPDESKLAFSALGYIWKKDLPDGRPRKITPDDYFAFEPAFSPDSKQLTYVSWHDENRGAVWKMSVSGRRAEKLTEKKGIYRNPSFSPDGSKILYRKEDGNMAMGLAYGVKPGIYWTDSEGESHHFVVDKGINPSFNSDGDRIFYQLGGYLFGSLDKSYRSMNLAGNDERTHFHSSYANQYALSPDNKWLAFGQLHNVYLMPFAATGKTFELSAEDDKLPIRKVSEDAGINLDWSADGNNLYWTLGDTLYKVGIQDVFSFVEGAPDSIPEVKPEKLSVQLESDFDNPAGRIALTGATIITMDKDSVINNGVVLTEGNRIIAVGPASEVNIPDNAKVYDLRGKYILPGFIDTHAHLNAFRYGLSPQKDWPYYANLAYGITATHDPSSLTEMSLSQAEMVKAGRMAGPRIYTTGTILYGAEGDFKAVINNLEDARSAIRRTAAYGTFTVKSYIQPRRNQRQQVIQAAKEQQVMVYPEGGSTFFHNMTMILDGHTGIEHNIPVAPLYDDVIQLWAASETANTPTLIVSFGSISGEYYWYQHTNVWENEKLLTFTPRSIVDSRARHRTMVPESEYENGHILVARSLKKLWDQGVSICVGGHGQLQGLGFHWEMWMLEQGGFTPMEVLQAATLEGAKYIGLDNDLGSLEPGKLSDLVVLDSNPLANIRNTTSISMTMVNGHLYEADTMNEIGNHPRERSRFYWEMDGYNADFGWHSGTSSGQLFRCLFGQ